MEPRIHRAVQRFKADIRSTTRFAFAKADFHRVASSTVVCTCMWFKISPSPSSLNSNCPLFYCKVNLDLHHVSVQRIKAWLQANIYSADLHPVSVQRIKARLINAAWSPKWSCSCWFVMASLLQPPGKKRRRCCRRCRWGWTRRLPLACLVKACCRADIKTRWKEIRWFSWIITLDEAWYTGCMMFVCSLSLTCFIS